MYDGNNVKAINHYNIPQDLCQNMFMSTLSNLMECQAINATNASNNTRVHVWLSLYYTVCSINLLL